MRRKSGFVRRVAGARQNMRLRIPSIQMDPQAIMATSIESPTGIKNDVEKKSMVYNNYVLGIMNK